MHTKVGHVFHVLYAMSHRHDILIQLVGRIQIYFPLLIKCVVRRPSIQIAVSAGDNIGLGMENPAMFKPRWEKRREDICCYVHGCNEKAYKQTNLQQGALSDTEGDEMLQLGFLAFLHLVGCAYMKKTFCCFSRPNTSILSGAMHVRKDAHKLARQTAEIYMG